MSLNSFLFDFHSLVEKGLKKPFDEAKVKLNQILFALQGTKIEDLKDDIFLIPGKFYSYSNPDATIENLTKLFNDLIDCQEFLISDDQVVVDVFLQIIAFDFKHFMELFSQQREKLPDLIVYKVYQVILDPTTGFLKNAPLSKRNNVWNDPNHYFQFFQKDSADLQTPFGKTLTSLREHLSKLLVDSLSEEKYEIVYNDRPTICIPSILPTLLSSIIPPYFFGSGIECGFPGRPQTLFAISKLQKLTTYSKFYKDHSDNQDIIDSWIDLYIEISGFETRVNEEKLNILRPTPIIWSPKISLFKLFLNITPTLWDVSNQSCSSNNSSKDDIKDKKYFQEMDIFAKHIVYSIIGQDSVYASFLIFWTQIMIYLIPKFSCIVFDHLFLLMDSYYKLSYNQKHTYTQSLIRFISILCCHYERYLDESQTIRIHSFAMLNLCSSSPSIRYLSLKLLRTLHRFLNNEDNQKKSILYFFDDPKGSSKFQESFLKIFRENPSILMQTNLLIPPIQPSIIDLIHSPNGRFVAVLGDDKYSILTTLGFRTKAFGKGFKFAWAQNSTNYAVLDVVGSVQLYQNFELDKTIDRFCKKIWGGTLLSVLADNGVEFYDWDSGLLIRRIEEKVSEVKWSGDIVAMRTKDTIFILQYFPPNPDDAENQYDESSGYENSFTLLHQIDAKSSSICWSSGILFFTENLKVNRFVSGIVQSTATLKTPVDLLGYLPRENLLVLVDYQRKIIGFNLPYALLDFEVSIADGEEPDPESVPEEYRASCAKFLKQIGQKELALEVATDPVMKFDLALELERLDVAQKLALEL